MDILLILSIALSIDLALGEPPRAIHAVAWRGKVISFLARFDVSRSSLAQFLYGSGITLVTIGLFAAPAYFMLIYLKGLSFAAYVIVGGVLLKFTFSLRELRRVALKVRRLLLK